MDATSRSSISKAARRTGEKADGNAVSLLKRCADNKGKRCLVCFVLGDIFASLLRDERFSQVKMDLQV
jgi:hypothetical protein